MNQPVSVVIKHQNTFKFQTRSDRQLKNSFFSNNKQFVQQFNRIPHTYLCPSVLVKPRYPLTPFKDLSCQPLHFRDQDILHDSFPMHQHYARYHVCWHDH